MLQILIGVLIIGIANASPKAAPKPIPKPKPIAKASPQFFQGYSGAQPNYFPGASSYFGQEFNSQPILGQDAAGQYDARFTSSGYQSTFGTAFGAQGAYPQASVGNYYQVPQAQAGSNYQGSQTQAANYYQPPQGPAGSYYQPQVQAGRYYQPQVPAGSYYQPFQAQAGSYYKPSQASAPNYYQYPQASAGNYYQSPQAPAGTQAPQLIPVPVAYPKGSSAQNVPQSVEYSSQSLTQSLAPVGPSGISTQNVQQYASGSSAQNTQAPSYFGEARLWPKVLISPAGSPSPVPDSLARAFYGVSTPSSLAFSTFNNQNPLSTQSSLPFSQQKLIPVPVKVGSRNHFQTEITNYNPVPQNIQIPSSTPSPYLANYQQQSNSASYNQRYLQPNGFTFSTTSAPNQPTAPHYPVNYQSSPAPFQINSLQQTTQGPPAQGNYQSTPAPPQQASAQPSTPSPYPFNYPQSTPGYYQGNNQFPGVLSRSPFADYQQQPTSSPNLAPYQQQSASPFGPNYQPTNYPYHQRIPVPVAYPQSQFEVQSTPPPSVPPTEPSSITSTPSYPTVPVTSKPINILTTSPPDREVSITENTFIPIPTPSSAANKLNAKIIKSEYSGTVSPQYNHIPVVSTSYKYSTLSPFLAESAGKSSHGLSYAPAKAIAAYYPSTAVSNVSFKGLGSSYSY